MPRLLAVTDNQRLLATLDALPAAWRIVVVPDPEHVATRVGGETSVVLIDGRLDDVSRATETVREHLDQSPCLVTGAAAVRHTGRLPPEALVSPAIPADELHGVLTRAVETGTATGVSGGTRRAPAAGGALLRRLGSQMVDGLGKVGAALAPSATAGGSGPVDQRIGGVLAALGEARTLMTDLPALGAIDRIAAALVDETVETLKAHVVVVWLPSVDDPDQYRVVAGHGLTDAERRMRVPLEHPVFADLSHNVNVVLLSPLDQARGLVAGLAGARGRSLMAASLDPPEPAVAEGERDGIQTPVGFVTVATEGAYEDRHLARLESIAAEAAAGIALARVVSDLSTKATTTNGDGRDQ